MAPLAFKDENDQKIKRIWIYRRKIYAIKFSFTAHRQYSPSNLR